MVIGQKIQDALNRQINAELYSAYLYLSMAAYYETLNLKGFAHWNRKQYAEETAHAMKMFDYINERAGRVILDAIAAPKKEWESPLRAFTETYEHEKKVTALIYELVTLAQNEKDYATENLLAWYVTEQVEEEANALSIVEKLKRAGDNWGALFMIDAELGRRE